MPESVIVVVCRPRRSNRLRGTIRRIRDALISVRRGLGHLLCRGRVPRPPGAAAGAKGPEQAGGHGASDGEPHVDVHGGADVEADALVAQRHGAGHGHAGVGEGGEEGKGEGEGGGDEGGEGGEEGAEAGEEAADADEDFDADGGDGEDVEGGDPFGPLVAVVVEDGAEVVAE